MEHKQGAPLALVSIKGVQHRYTGAAKMALSDIDLTIPAGSCFGLLGPNGAGKTTLISLLTGALPLQHGSIQVDALTLPQQVQQLKKISALVPQDYAFYPALTARENLTFFAGLYQIPASALATRINYCVEVCNLSEVLDQMAGQYSGGIKRRLNLAIGLLSEPKIIYLDEPTVGIDAQSRQFILQAIESLKASGMTIVYTSHYMEEVERICDEIAIINHGRVLLQEKMSALLKTSKQLTLTPSELPSAACLASLKDTQTISWNGQHFLISPSSDHPLSTILSEFERRQITIDHLKMEANHLEDIYLNKINLDSGM